MKPLGGQRRTVFDRLEDARAAEDREDAVLESISEIGCAEEEVGQVANQHFVFIAGKTVDHLLQILGMFLIWEENQRIDNLL